GCTAGLSPQPSLSATSPATSTAPAVPPPSTGPFNQELHDELVAMLERDQSSRTGGPVTESDQARTDRLEQIIYEFGWPTVSLVGEDGEDAAWAMAQHSDLDREFQRFALEQLRAAVDIDQASPGNLAYLEDRVATGAGEPQTYGTQVRCGPDGPVPATPINDETGLEQRRADAGLDPFADYLAEMAVICAEIPE
ncbi:MAG TPA: DUF6624 domain-containing protein, partial [Homoserinimonas sp.]|nr:DUF6624 domain-containing protein [Homoserinimonas sp.]